MQIVATVAREALIRLRFLFLATLVVHSLGAGSSIGARGDANSILGLGLSASGCLGGFHAVLIRLLNGGVTRMWVVCRLRAGVDLCGCHSACRLLCGGHRASIRVDGNGTLTIAANGLAKPVSDAIGGKHICSKQHKRHSQ